jgi:hypothetical protein
MQQFLVSLIAACLLIPGAGLAAEPLLEFGFAGESKLANKGTLGAAGDLKATGKVATRQGSLLTSDKKKGVSCDVVLPETLTNWTLSIRIRPQKPESDSGGIIACDTGDPTTSWELYGDGTALYLTSTPPLKLIEYEIDNTIDLVFSFNGKTLNFSQGKAGKTIALEREYHLSQLRLGNNLQRNAPFKSRIWHVSVWQGQVAAKVALPKKRPRNKPATSTPNPTAAVKKPPAPAAEKKSAPSRWYDSGIEAEKTQSYARALRFYDLAIGDGDERAQDRKDGLLELYGDVLADCKAAAKAGNSKSAKRRLDYLIKQFGETHAKEAMQLRKTLK